MNNNWYFLLPRNLWFNMKKILIILLLSLFLILTLFEVNANNTIFPLIGKTIVLDAGHGGKDFGASVNDTKESEINLEVTLKLKKELEKNGAIVLLTRTNENDLSNPNAIYRKKSDFDERIKIINNYHADLYLSIHQNIYQNKKYYGPQVFYYPKINNNELLAQTIQDELNKLANTKRKIKIVTNTYMYNKLNINGVLIECGFLSNDNERYKLKQDNYQNNLVKTITNAIIKYFS